MSDNLRRYRAIRDGILQWYPSSLNGHQSRHLITLAMLISGIVGSQHSHLDKVAAHVPGPAKPASRTKRFARWLDHDTVTPAVFFVPFARALLHSLAHLPLVLLLDGSTVGRGCVALMVSVAYRGRALPLAWVVVRGAKGHFSEDMHLNLLHLLLPLLPRQAQVVLVGDGEFDNLLLQQSCTALGWSYVCRTASNIPLYDGETWLTSADLAAPGCCVGLCCGYTRQAYGPVLVIAWWEAGYAKPLYLVSNLELVEEACYWYGKRFHIETFFSDQKSRGFQLHKSHLRAPLRVQRLMIAACLGYLWIVYLGTLAHGEDWVGIIHRTDRCDLSLFQLGLRLLEYWLNEQLPISVAFVVLLLEDDWIEYVR